MTRSRASMSYRCRYCNMGGFTKSSLYDHIKSTSCSTSHYRQPHRERQPRVVEHPTGNDQEAIDDNTCCICLRNKPVIVSNCGHKCVCIGCSNNIFERENLCPICRAPRGILIKVF